MQFTTIFALAAAVVGVSANVHSTCYCTDANNKLDKATTAKSCTFVSISGSKDQTLCQTALTSVQSQSTPGWSFTTATRPSSRILLPLSSTSTQTTTASPRTLPLARLLLTSAVTSSRLLAPGTPLTTSRFSLSATKFLEWLQLCD